MRSCRILLPLLIAGGLVMSGCSKSSSGGSSSKASSSEGQTFVPQQQAKQGGNVANDPKNRIVNDSATAQPSVASDNGDLKVTGQTVGQAVPAAPASHVGYRPEPTGVSPENAVSLPEGMAIAVRMDQTVDGNSQPGMHFRGRLAEPVNLNGQMVFPAGAEVQGYFVGGGSAPPQRLVVQSIAKPNVGDVTVNAWAQGSRFKAGSVVRFRGQTGNGS